MADVGRGIWDIVSVPSRVMKGEIAPNGPEAARMALAVVPMADFATQIVGAGGDVGRAVQSSGGLGLMSEAQANSPYDVFDQRRTAIEKQMQVLQKEKEAASAALAKRIEKLGPGGKRDANNAFDAEWQRKLDPLTTEMGDLAKARAAAAGKAADADLVERTRRDAEAAKKREAEAPFRERNPPWAQAFNSMAMAVPSAMGLRAGYRGAQVQNRQAQRVEDATAAEGAARDAFKAGTGDATAYANAQNALIKEFDVFDAARSKGVGASMAKDAPLLIGAGGTAGALAAAPEMIDFGMPKGTRAGDNARNLFSSGDFWGQKAAIGALGAGLAEGGKVAGGLIPRAPVPATGRALALKERDGPITPESASAYERGGLEAGQIVQDGYRTQLASRQLADRQNQLTQEALSDLSGRDVRKAMLSGLRSRIETGGGLLPDPPPLALPPPSGSRQTNSFGNSSSRQPQSSPQIASAQLADDALPAAVSEFLASPKKGQDWSNKFSESARSYALDQVGAGSNLARRTKTNGNESGLLVKDLSEAVGAPLSTAERHLGMLRQVLEARGVDPSSVSRSQLERILQSLDKRVFSAPVGVGLGGGLLTDMER